MTSEYPERTIGDFILRVDRRWEFRGYCRQIKLDLLDGNRGWAGTLSFHGGRRVRMDRSRGRRAVYRTHFTEAQWADIWSWVREMGMVPTPEARLEYFRTTNRDFMACGSMDAEDLPYTCDFAKCAEEVGTHPALKLVRAYNMTDAQAEAYRAALPAHIEFERT